MIPYTEHRSRARTEKLRAALVLAAVCLLFDCVPHSHQAENLSVDVNQGQMKNQLSSLVDEHQNGHGAHDHGDEADHHTHDHQDDEGGPWWSESGHGGSKEAHPVHNHLDYRLWLVAFGAILFISLWPALFGVFLIPSMQKALYQHLIQFLIALAVGTLAGDALLHLLPHALLAGVVGHHSHAGGGADDEERKELHSEVVWKGFVVIVALIAFFFCEKVINAVGECKRRRKALKRRRSTSATADGATTLNGGGVESGGKQVRIVRSGHEPSGRVVGETVCKNKYSDYCVADVEPRGGGGCVGGDHNNGRKVVTNSSSSTPLVDAVETELMLRSDGVGNGNGSGPTEIPVISEEGEEASQNAGAAGKEKEESSAAAAPVETVFINQHEHSHHGHSHAHSHIVSKPDSVSSVAWMVIFGDGIHNMADGMAIGAAFGESYISGLSTSIAVLCHELPHEVGDFAMLLKAGMSVKQAIVYNLLSSFLSLVGMVIGLLLGNIENWSSWIFCATAGIFLYVALVDMVPELNSGHNHPSVSSDHDDEEHRGEHRRDSKVLEIAVQASGMCLGVAIMMLIALYEDNFGSIFVSAATAT